MINTGIYIRVSTEEQAKDGFSIHAQKEKLTMYAKINDWVIHDYYIDNGISGKNLDRKEVTRLINDIKNGLINNVLIYKLDRLTRSVKDLVYLIELFEKYSCTFSSQTEKIDTSNAVGRMFVKIIGIFAEFERENLAERVSFGYEQKTREGNYTNTNGVYGYDYHKTEKKYLVNEEEKELVNKIFDLYINGNSFFKIAKLLNDNKTPTKRGGNWASGTIKSIITNPLYIGKIRYGLSKKNHDKSFIVDSKNIIPIISIDKWNIADELFNKRKRLGTRRYASELSYYFHTIRCSKCGELILARRQKHNNKIYITYRCKNNDTLGFSHNLMEKAFVNYLDSLDNLMIDDNIFYKEDKNNELETKINKLLKKKKMIRKEFINESINKKEYQELEVEIDKQIKYLNNLISSEENINYDLDEIKDLVINIKLNWEYLNNKEKQLFLERFIDKILVDKQDKKIIIKNVLFKT